MIVALTGTPGTGKSRVAKILSNIYEVRSISDLAKKMDCVLGEEIERDEKILIIDVECLSKKISEKISKEYGAEKTLVIEGHLSHLLPSDVVIILRCNPVKLKERLSAKGWKEEKILENVEAELLDVILVEALEEAQEKGGKSVYEIDTTDRSVKEVSTIVIEIIENVRRGRRIENFIPGKVDWISEIGEEIDRITR